MEDKKISKKGKEWLKREMRPYRGNIVFLTALGIVSTLLSLAFAYLVRYLINGAEKEDKALLLLFAGILLGIVFLRVLASTLSVYFAEKYRAKITVGLRIRLFGRLLCADYSSVEKYHSGDLLNRMTADVNEVAADTVSIMPAVAGMIVQCVGAISALATINPLFTAVFTAGGVAVGCISAVLRRKMKRYHKELMEADGKSRSFMQEGFVSLLTLKAYGAQERMEEKSRDILSGYYRKRMQRNLLRSGTHAAFSFLSNAGMILAVVWCSIRVLKGESDYGSILSVVLLLGQLQHPFASFSAVLPVCYARAASGERLSETDELPTESLGEAKRGINAAGIAVKDLSFSYGRDAVFAGANASMDMGETVCITGASGSGKSTLFKLILDVYLPESGGVYIRDGKGQFEKIGAEHRGLFAYVPQGNFLFSGTIYENLTFFSECTDERALADKIEKALKAACAEFVGELPEGLNTPLRERGGGLSEGQLQRLAIARALLSERSVLLLDEATSALDGETEKKVLENIGAMTDKTCLIVTHRPAALAIADKVWNVENGKIFETVKNGGRA
ncbi:MAG: ABC transporter ATP-binding protein [Clostridia bacterium]|nr:ABC transporter ATP-binding protein [Clostridia bacterium]